MKINTDNPLKGAIFRKYFYKVKGITRVRIHPKSIAKMKAKIKELTSRSNGWGNKFRTDRIKRYIVGWVNYFKIADMQKLMLATDEWLRRRIWMIYWKQWKRVRTRFRELMRLGIDKGKARQFANTRKGYWRTSNSPILNYSMDNQTLRNLGYIFFSDYYRQVRVN